MAKRHLSQGGLVLYDLSSSYFEGSCCPLADGKKGKLKVNYGLVTDVRGCPVAVSVFDGATADCKTVMPQVRRIQAEFGIEHMVVVGDRGMISQKAIDEFNGVPGVAWITALKSAQIRALVDEGGLQMRLFDERNLFEFTHPNYPGERLVACRNPQLAQLRAAKRAELFEGNRRRIGQGVRDVRARKAPRR